MRLFIGCPVPPSPLYRALVDDLPVSGARPVVPGTHHITLRFLGDVSDPAPVVKAMEWAASGLPAMECVVRGVGAFPSDDAARVLWAAVEAPGIDALAARLREATGGMGTPEADRPFVPHVTMARLDSPATLSRWIGRRSDRILARGSIDRVVLYRSHLGGDGPPYERLHEAPLAKA